MTERLENIPISVAVRAILVNEEGKVLLVKRAPKTLEGGKWCIPGGRPNDGEETVDAVVREIKEEVGIEFPPLYYYGEVENPNIIDGQRWNTHYFIGEVDSLPSQLQEEEVSEVSLFFKSQLQEIDIAFDHREVLMRYFEEFL